MKFFKQKLLFGHRKMHAGYLMMLTLMPSLSDRKATALPTSL